MRDFLGKPFGFTAEEIEAQRSLAISRDYCGGRSLGFLIPNTELWGGVNWTSDNGLLPSLWVFPKTHAMAGT